MKTLDEILLHLTGKHATLEATKKHERAKQAIIQWVEQRIPKKKSYLPIDWSKDPQAAYQEGILRGKTQALDDIRKAIRDE